MTHEITLKLDEQQLEMLRMIGWALRNRFIDNKTVLESEKTFPFEKAKEIGIIISDEWLKEKSK